jgi:hypothetical protein
MLRSPVSSNQKVDLHIEAKKQDGGNVTVLFRKKDVVDLTVEENLLNAANIGIRERRGSAMSSQDTEASNNDSEIIDLDEYHANNTGVTVKTNKNKNRHTYKDRSGKFAETKKSTLQRG